jgi:hypothetical protein
MTRSTVEAVAYLLAAAALGATLARIIAPPLPPVSPLPPVPSGCGICSANR